jgi:hypothetical protein
MATERSFANLGAKAIELDVAWTDRLVDAEHLMSAGRYPTAIAMGLYALEIRLKARICQHLHLDRLPKPFEIHDLEGLMMVSGLRHALSKARPVKIRTNWARIIKEFAADHNELRYLPNTSKTQLEAEEFFVLLKEPSTGVIPWISSQP